MAKHARGTAQAPRAKAATLIPASAKKAPGRREKLWLALGVYLPILVGAAARLAVVNDVRFTGEEALFYSEAHAIARGGDLPWYGPRMSGSGYHPGPLFFVICAVPLLAGDDPALVHAWLVLLNMLGIALIVRLTLRLHGVRAAGIVSAMLSSSPWQFVYSVGIWQPHVMLPILATVLWCLDRVKRVERSWALGLLLPVLAASFQIHPSCIMVWLLAVAVAVVQRPRINLKALAVGLVLALAAYMPYLNHELRNDFENTRRVASDAEKYAWSLTNPVRALACHFAMTSANINFHVKHGYWDPVPATLADEWRRYWEPDDAALRQLGWGWPVLVAGNVVSLLLAAAVVVVWLTEWIRFVKPRGRGDCGVLRLGFLFCPVLVFLVVLLGRKPVYPNYVLFVLAAPFFGYPLLDGILGRVVKPRYNLVIPVLTAMLFLPRLGVAVAYVREVDSRRGLSEQKAFARWVAQRGPLKNVRGLEWYNSGVKGEPIPLTLARCWAPELLKGQSPSADAFGMAAEALATDDARRAYLGRRVKGSATVVEFQVNERTTFLRWRRGVEN